MKIGQCNLPTDYTTPNVVYVQQANYPRNKEISFSTFMYRDSITLSNNPYVVAVFRVKRKTTAPIEIEVRASMEVFAVN